MASKIEVDEIFNAGGDNDTGIDLATNDQILLKVANATRLTMNSTGQTTIVGEGGTTTTNLQQGLLKAWSKVDGTGTAAVNDSLNISGITDNSTGNYTLAMSNAMGVNTYAQTHGANAAQQAIVSATTSAYRLECSNSSGTAADVSVIGSQISGDLA